jgi:hypothetical protein
MDSTTSPITEDSQSSKKRPSRGRRALRALARFLIAAFIGVAGTLAWQSYGEATKQMIAVCLEGWSPTWQSCVEPAKQMVASWPRRLGWPPPEIATEPSPEGPALAQNARQAEPVVEVAAAEATPTVTSFSEPQQLEAVARDLASVRQLVEKLAVGQEQLAGLRQRVEQLAAGQEQLAIAQEGLTRDVAKLQTAEQDIAQEIPVPPPRPARKPLPVPPAPSRAPIQPR